MIKKIYLHWTAGRYNQLFDDYHLCIDGNGCVHKMADFETKLAHTWKRNSNAVGIALCCCYGAHITYVAPPLGELSAKLTEGVGYGAHITSVAPPLGELSAKLTEGVHIHWGSFPPTEIQIVSMARCVAEICKEHGLPIRKDTVMTHAEVAALDGYSVYDNDPDLRWDLFRLPGYETESGGDIIRRIAKLLYSTHEDEVPSVSPQQHFSNAILLKIYRQIF